jgi:SAM-dependent methyltransferase
VTIADAERITPRPTEPADWFEQSFGEEYLRLYPHRDETDAAEAIELIAAHMQGKQIDAVLDLACGAGRHARLLCDRWWTVGLDLSQALLRVARSESPDAPYVRADMRELPFATESFDLAVNLFTSFGYFDDDHEHAQVLKCVGAATKRGGTFVLDFLNPEDVRKNLVGRDERVVGGAKVEQFRRISADRKFVEKTIRVRDKEYLERVRLFSRPELEQMLEAAGFDVVTRAGDYSGAPWSEDSRRTILFSRRR